MSQSIESTTPKLVPTVNPKWMTWTGRVLSGLPILMIVVGGIFAAFNPQMMKDGNAQMGWPESATRWLIPLEIVCGLLYAFPKTATLGAILLTGYFGGAVATHARVGDVMWFIPVIFGVIVWLGLFLREPRLRAILPWRKRI